MPILINGVDSTSIPKRSIFLSAQGGIPTTTAGCAAATQVESSSNKVNYYNLAFDKDTVEYAEWNYVMPDNYDGGSITARFYWTAASGSGSVIWRIAGSAFADSDAIDMAFGTAVSVTDTLLTALDIHISSESSPFTLAGTVAGGEYVAIRANRFASDGSDDLSVDALLLGIKLRYGTNYWSD